MHTYRIQTYTTIALTIFVLAILSFSSAFASTYSKGNVPGEIIVRLTEPLNPVKTAQGVRFKGEFDTNLILFVGGSVRYVF